MPDPEKISQLRSTQWALGRNLALVAVYSAVLTASRYLSYELRFDFLVPSNWEHERLWSIAISLPVKLGFLLLFRQFGSLLTYFSVPDMIRIVAAIGCANLAAYLARWGIWPEFMTPRGVVLIDFVISTVALASVRLGFRIYRERFLGQSTTVGQKVRRIAVLGAGDAGAQFVREAQTRPGLRLRSAFFLDDNRAKHGHEIHGVPILGAPEDIGRLHRENPVDSCVLAMPSASGRRLQQIYKLLSAEGLKVETIPSVAELATGRVQVTRIRPVQVEDLLGRAAVDLKSPEVMAMVSGKVVLVTGAGGSIGSELCRQLCGYNPQRVLLVEQCEGSLFNIESELNELGFPNLFIPLVADIGDLVRMRQILQLYSPAIIFHAAAHKHVYMMERQPGEAVKNNTTGTRELAELAAAAGVETFVLISTDKAINPTSAMGATKRMAEIHLQAMQARPEVKTRFIAVRFGNVLGSSGSVIPIFKRQIAAGGPVTVTHPDVTRYFMTIPEAVGLVLQTAVFGQAGKIYVLDMGKPVRIMDLARQLVELSGLKPDEDIEIQIIGLRAGEKLFEEVQHHSENLEPTSHARVSMLTSDGILPGSDWPRQCIAELEERVGELNANELKLAIKRFVPEYEPYLD